MFSTYILRSKLNGSYYIGSTNNINDRIKRHNKGYSRYTRGKGPFVLVYREDFNSGSDAKKREYYLKSLKSRKAIEKLIKRPVRLVA